MNIMRKFLPGGASTSQSSTTQVGDAGDGAGASTSKPPEQELLGLNHLKKLYFEYQNPSHPLTEGEKEERLYAMMPLFCKIFSNVGLNVISSKFESAISFTQSASKLLVTEVRRRASNQSTEAAAQAIAAYMQIDEKTTEPGKNGWLLLTALNMLLAEGPAFLEALTSSAVPSTLVKCLYLFFDLPQPEESGGVDLQTDSEAEFSHKEKRILLQKMFLQILIRLCAFVPAVEELSRKNDLTLLFSAVTSSLPDHNLMWRKTAGDILLTVSRNSLSQPVVSYLHNKGCIALCIENMQRSTDLKPLEIVEMFVTVFCFLKDSAEESQTLLEDFRTCQGYIFLSEFLLKLELTTEADWGEAARNLVLLIATLSFCGHIELKYSSGQQSTFLYKLENFEMPEPENKGSTVRNLSAFQVLQSVFLKSKSVLIGSTILDAISTIYSADDANYFLLEQQHTLIQFSEKISMKSPEVQEKFFQLIEFLVHRLRFVPCKELIAVSLVLKSHQSIGCCILAGQSLGNILKFDPIFKDVFREVGMMEAFLSCLSTFAKDIDINSSHSNDDQQKLGDLVLSVLADLVSGNSQNAAVFRESQGVSIVLTLVRNSKTRFYALLLMQQLILASGNEEDMRSLLELLVLRTAPSREWSARTEILQTVISCLKESHRTRTVFRKVVGFIYPVSVLGLIAMDGLLQDDVEVEDETLLEIYELLRSVFNSLAIAMRYEPANAKYFQIRITAGGNFFESIRSLGCFQNEKSLSSSSLIEKVDENFLSVFGEIFNAKTTAEGYRLALESKKMFPKSLFSSCLILRMLYDLAIDAGQEAPHSAYLMPSLSKCSTSSVEETDDVSICEKRLKISSLNLTSTPPDPIIVHPSILTAMLKLLPCLGGPGSESLALKFHLAETIKSLLRTEKNQQIMSDIDFLSDLFSVCKPALENDNHPLHIPFQYLLERLAAQKLEPKDLREFLRLGNPLACLNPEETEAYCKENTGSTPGSFVPLTRVKTLVSMTTPRDLHVQDNTILPPFVEFDMNQEGFGCMYLPSLAPSSPHAASVVSVTTLASQESSVIGGIGLGDRAFPPQPGLTFASWICINKFSDPRSDPHPVRLLTVGRQLNNSGQEEHYSCLSISLSERDKALIVSTQEVPLHKNNDWHPSFSGDFSARVWFPDLIKEGEWHHIVIVLNRQVLKNSTFSLFVNGQHVTTQRMQYICQNPGANTTSNLTQAACVYAYIGTPPQWRRPSRLCWKQGPCILTEDIASPTLASLLYKLGPHYLGSLQAPQISSSAEVMPSQIAEEKIIMGLNAVAVSQITLLKMKRIYSKVDIKSIAKILGMSSSENATPIRVVHNSAGHLLGPARSLGGVIIGYLGVRVFNPQPVSKVLETVGGCDALLAIIAMSRDMESLYAGVKALVCVLKSNPFARYEIEANRGYQTLAMLLRKKLPFLNSHILHLCFTMAGTLETGPLKEPEQGQGSIPNVAAFRDVLCDLELWHDAPTDLEKSLFENFLELISDSGTQRHLANIRLLREFSLVEKLLTILKKGDCSNSTNLILLKVIHGLLCTNPRVTDVLCFALFTAATLNPTSESERGVRVKPNSDGTEQAEPEEIEEGDEQASEELVSTVVLRNRCLKLFFSLLYVGNKIHSGYCEDVAQVVGFDWVQLFLQGHLHQTTVVWGLRILMTLLSQPVLLQKFRHGNWNGFWLIKSEVVLQNKMGQALGQVSSTGRVARRGIRSDIFYVPGFQQFNWLMPKHIDISEVYFLLMAMVLGQPVKTLPQTSKLDLDSVWNFVFGTSASETSQSDLAGKVNLNGDAMVTILCMVRTMLNCETRSPDRLPNWLKEYPVILTQFLFYLYHNVIDFMQVFMTAETLTALAGTLFPVVNSTSASPSESPFGSPTKEKPTLESASSVDSCDSAVMVQSFQDETLTNHPAKRNVMNFMRVLIVDALSLPASPKTQPVVDLLIEAQPENTTHAQQCRFQTELLGIVMDHLLAADILIGEQAALPIVHGGSANHIAPNVFYLASRLVDKLWQGVFKKEPEEVFVFILKLISQAKRRGSASISLDGIYRCLNRTILYMFARPNSRQDDITSQMVILEVLHKIVDNRNMIFCAGNHEPEFFASLTFCLLHLTCGQKIPLEGEGKSQWHVRANPDIKEEDAGKIQGQNLVVNATARVWELMYVSKKPVLEEAFKTSFGQQNATPPLESITQQIQEQASKIWFNYVDLEKRSCYSKIPPWEFHTQLQSKIQRVTGGFAGGLKRLTSVGGGGNSSGRPKVKKEETKVELSPLPKCVVEHSTLNHIAIVKDVVEAHYKNRALTDEHMLKYTEEEWLATETRLTQERGLWGPFNESPLTKWSLDMTEGPSRMRKRLVRNDLFYWNYPFRDEEDENEVDKPHKYKRPSSHDSKVWFQKHRSLAMFEREHNFVAMEYDDCDVSVAQPQTIDDQLRSIGFQGLKNVIGQATTLNSDTADDDLESGIETGTSNETSIDASISTTKSNDSPLEVQSPGTGVSETNIAPQQEDEENSSGYQTVMRLLEDGEKITHMFRCARVQGLDTAEGLLLFGREHFYILDGFTLVNGREVHDINHIPNNYYDPIIPTVPGQVNRLIGKRQVSKYAHDSIKEVHKRRYLLQPIGVEVFCSDGQNQFLAFPKSVRSKVYQKLLSLSSFLSDSAVQSVAGQRRSANVEQSSGLFSSLIGETSVTQRWVRGEISNFQYLMALNTLAGRSYNDLMQYPVFPWILADYYSEELDLTNPKTFRDLTKPMGAQTSSRLDQFMKRFSEWDDPSSETPPYHYGTHYSSAMIVSSYLVRLEPFTQHFLHLQGGHFDLADRMFHSIEEAWDSSSRNNMADVRELIPEFFYLPDFLENRNRFDIGTKQNGESLNNVVLPPWAKNSSAEFIRMHREALESDFVSQNLHSWIDLIFGYKQKGPAAVEAVNVYHHLFYEGNVDIFSIKDPLQRNATIGFINNFGQIPKQLFKKPHPVKKISSGVDGTGGSGNAGSQSTTGIFFHNLTNLRPTMAPIKELKGPVGQIQHADRIVYAVDQNKVLVPGNSNRYLAWGYADQSFRLGNYESDKAIFVCEPSYLIGQVCTCVCPNARLVLTAGTSSVVAVYEYHKKQKQLLIKRMLHGHTDAVVSLAASPAWSIAVSGSRDRTAIIWDLSRLNYIKHMPGHVGPVAAVAINELTGDIVTCAGSWLYLWDVNGRPIAKVNTAPIEARPIVPGRVIPTSQILCVACSQFQEWDRENVIMTGSSDGVVRMWSLDYEEVPISQVKIQTPDDKFENDGNESDDPNSTEELSRKIRSGFSETCNNFSTVTTDGDAPKSSSNQNQSTTSDDFVVVSQGDFDGHSRVTDPVNKHDPEPGSASSIPPPNDGYTWEKNLIFRAKLTMHTAYERLDNSDPAGVTALATSKDHKAVYVGDEKGRVFAWTVSSKPGKGMVDHWVKDEGVVGCTDCGVKFTIYERKHHCRNCGKVFCSSCSQYQAKIPRLRIPYQVRVCKTCHTELKDKENIEESEST